MSETELNHEQLVGRIAKELSLPGKRIESVISLLEEGNTVPFIARYRKEATGGLDEVQIKDIMESWQYIQNLEQRKEDVIRLIDEQGKLTEELKQQITKADKLQKVEDLYRPYKQKRRTKATMAKEKGLEPLADWLFLFPKKGSVEAEAKKYLSEDKGVGSIEEALQGAKDIIAERVADDPDIRQWVRNELNRSGKMVSTVKQQEADEKSVYEIYYEYEEPVKKIVPHRVLALNRGEKEDILKVSVKADTDRIVGHIKRRTIKNDQAVTAELVGESIEDSYKRLIEPAVEREIRNELTAKAEDQAIHIFSENLRNLLLQPPLKGKIVLGVDPAYRTGCKLAVVDETGKLLYIDVIYPHPPKAKPKEAKDKTIEVIKRYHVELIAVGNGTASQETEQFIAGILKELGGSLAYMIVNEAGASVYSASDLAREEFPDLQVEERSAVSIARRLQDPLAELVKIDPKSIGVGQYQHDVAEKKLNEQLGFVVETAVNRVGVNVNTASSSLLQYVSGLSKTVANNIVKQREEAGKYTSRTQLKKIPRLGAKTYEQAIGFMRIPEGKDPLDATAIHPESYPEVKKLLASVGLSPEEVGTDKMTEALKGISVEKTAEELGLGVPTLQDILESLMRPGRDLRDDLPKPLLKKDLMKLEDLTPGMELQGTVRNVVDFGAFVDVGVKEDGLVHISKLSNRFVKHPLDVVALGDIVTVWVENVDVKKGRLSLTMVQSDQK